MGKPVREPLASTLTRLGLFEDLVLGFLLASTLLLFTTQLNSHFTLPKLAVFAVLLVPLLALMLVRIRLGVFQVIPRMIWIPLLLLVTWWLIGTSQSVHLSTALNGQYGRYNGLYANLLLVSLFIAVASIPFDIKRLRRLMLALFIMALLVCCYTFIQYLGYDFIFKQLQSGRPFSSIGNPVALAVVLVLVIPYMIAGALRASSRTRSRVLLAVLLVLSLLAMVLTKSRGPLLALVAALMLGGLLTTIYAQRLTRDKRIAVAIALVLLLVVLGASCYLGLCDSLFQGQAVGMRLIYFQAALEMISASPLFGYGFETFRMLYPLFRPIDDYTYGGTVVTPTMIHNDYLQLAVDNGLPSMVFYLLFIGAVTWWLFKAVAKDSQQRMWHVAGLMMLTGFLVQGMSGWLEISSSVMFWVMLGVSLSLALRGEDEINSRPLQARYAYMTVTISGVLAAILISGVMLQKVKAEYWLGQAQYYSKAIFTKTDQYIDRVDKVAREDHYYQDQIGYLYYQRLQQKPAHVTYLKARKYYLRARKLNEYDAFIRFHNISLDARALNLRLIRQPSNEVVADMQAVLELDPNSPMVYEVRSHLHLAAGNNNAARQDYMKYLQLVDESR